MFRIATYNLENLDEDTSPDSAPSFAERAAIIRPALERLRADIICFQEINGQERDGEKRDILALKDLLGGTRYANHHLLHTKTESGNEAYNERNLVTAIPADWQVLSQEQINQDRMDAPVFKRTVAGDQEAKPVRWERPLLYLKVQAPGGAVLHIVNVHFKSKLASAFSPLMEDSYTWKNASGWAEGFFLSSVKRVGAALEARLVIDDIFTEDPGAAILILGDFNAKSDEVPVVALRGRVEETGNGALAERVMVPLEDNVPESARFTLYHHGQGEMIDHILVSRRMLSAFSHTEIHNEILPDESLAFRGDRKFPEPDHAPVVAAFHDDLLTP
ncbi:endonuclease [Rhodophyticola sp. CCM32]|uniref:endonuclease/exonuclease/phosphatase family protein n=1 Tax=Rhodophyticola sp. CCM32 TaxID=2916397 RepID=UPI00107F01C7|nr:endonuclease/exonuclease/phosphatase family protein [Rhodophyticola sp. CCM32]QBY02447.1 endonuclease [Rhodophyticola sp. CCM32]